MFCISLSPNPLKLKEKLLLTLAAIESTQLSQTPTFSEIHYKNPEVFIMAIVLDSGFEVVFSLHIDTNSRMNEKFMQPSTSRGMCWSV